MDRRSFLKLAAAGVVVTATPSWLASVTENAILDLHLRRGSYKWVTQEFDFGHKKGIALVVGDPPVYRHGVIVQGAQRMSKAQWQEQEAAAKRTLLAHYYAMRNVV